MPYMRVSLSKKLTDAEKADLAKALGEPLGLIPGKHGSMLIADIEDGKSFFVGGVPQENFAFVDIRYYSEFEFHIKKRFVEGVFQVLREKLGTTDDKISMTISEFRSWGGFGSFVDERYEDPKAD